MSSSPSTNEPQLRAVPLGLFPTLETLKGAVDYADSLLPITSRNQLIGVLAVYHNTLLKVAKEQV